MKFNELQMSSLKRLEKIVHNGQSITHDTTDENIKIAECLGQGNIKDKTKNLFIKIVDGISHGKTYDKDFSGTRYLTIRTDIYKDKEVKEITRTKLFKKLINSSGLREASTKEDAYYDFCIDNNNYDKFSSFVAKAEGGRVKVIKHQ